MPTPHGNFVWYELMTSDPAAAQNFYKSVIGWGMQDSGVPGMNYTMLTVDGAGVGGLMAIPEEAARMGARPGWIGYVWVDDVDASAEAVARDGGKVHRAPDDIPGVGRFAIIADPQGAVLALFRGAMDPQDAPPRPAPGTPGHVGWHELHAGEGKSAFAFYAGLFGWAKGEGLDMGPMGIYQLFSTGAEPVGGMMTKMPGEAAPFWRYYINVDSIDPATTRVRDAGGQVLMEPQQVPGGSWVVHCLDPQGAMFALVGPRH